MPNQIRYAWRALVKAPAFTLTVMATLAIGIGASTAIFSVVNALLLRPLPYPDDGQMVMVWQDHTRRDGPAKEWFTPPNFVDLRELDAYAAVSAVGTWSPTLTSDDGAETLAGNVVTHAFFDVVGVRPALGTAFPAESEAPGADPLVVLGHDLWQRRFNADPSIIGRTIQLNDIAHTVVGVMPEGFRDPLSAAEIWRSRIINVAACGRGCYTIQILARLSDGVDVAQAELQSNALAARLAAEFPGPLGKVQFDVVGLRDDMVSQSRPALIGLAVAVTFLLLIACVNVANLLVARAGVRERELSIRTALGADRNTIVQQLLVETLLLSTLGALAGAMFAVWAIDALVALAPAGTPRIDEVGVDITTLLCALTLGVITTLLAGVGPALQAARGGISDILKETGGSRTSVTRRRTRSALVVAEFAIALTLLIGAGLTLKNLARLQNVSPGFDPAQIATGFYGLPARRYDGDAVKRYIDQAIEQVGALPGVDAVATTSILPMSAGGDNDTSFDIVGHVLAPGERNPVAWYRMVSPGYFEVMGMTIVSGRTLSVDDRANAPGAIVVNETLQQRYFRDGSAVGRQIVLSEDMPPFTIVGVVADARMRGLTQPPVAEMFASYQQLPDNGVNLIVRSAGDPLAVTPSVREAMRALDPNVPLPTFRAMTDVVAQTIALPRLYSAFFLFFAAIALLLAAVGIYGLTSYAVGQRRQEIGIRMALGARARDVVGMVVRQSMMLTVLGMFIGVACALALAQPLTLLLHEMSARDVGVFVTVPLVLGAVALVATWVPARRAARMDPLVALRAD